MLNGGKVNSNASVDAIEQLNRGVQVFIGHPDRLLEAWSWTALSSFRTDPIFAAKAKMVNAR
jgi:hypothetical protein